MCPQCGDLCGKVRRRQQLRPVSTVTHDQDQRDHWLDVTPRTDAGEDDSTRPATVHARVLSPLWPAGATAHHDALPSPSEPESSHRAKGTGPYRLARIYNIRVRHVKKPEGSRRHLLQNGATGKRWEICSFHHINGRLAAMDEYTSTQMPLTPPFGKELSDIRARLERELPPGAYLQDADLAATLKISVKTLANRRSANRSSYPSTVKIGAGRKNLYPRQDLIDWLASEELNSKHTVRHRCH